MPRASSKQDRWKPQSTSANDILNSNSTAAHFINYPRPMWLQQNSNPYPQRGQFLQNIYTPRPLHAPASAAGVAATATTSPSVAPSPSALPNHLNKNRHDSIGSVQNSIGLPSPVPSHDASSTRASPENNQIQGVEAETEQPLPQAASAVLGQEGLPLPQHQRHQYYAFSTPQTMNDTSQEISTHERQRSRLPSQNGEAPPSSEVVPPPQTHISQPSHHGFRMSRPSSRQEIPKAVPGLPPVTQASLHAYYDAPQCRIKIEQYFKGKTVQNQLQQPLVKLRDFMLSAIKEPLDSFYFLLLQLVCVYAVNPEKIPKVFQNIPAVHFSLAISGNIFSSLGGFPLEFARYFAPFPRDISQISLLPNELIVAVVTFLQHLPSRYERAREVIRQRGFSLSPREYWSAFAPITGPCSRLLHRHFLYAAFQLHQPDVVESLDDMFVQCQNSVLAHLDEPGHAAAAQSRFETLSRSIMHKALEDRGTSLSAPTTDPLPTALQRPVGRQATMQESMMQQPAGPALAGYTPATQHYAPPQSLPTVVPTQQSILQHPASSTARFIPITQYLPAHIQPRPGHPVQHQPRAHSARNSTTFHSPQLPPDQLGANPAFPAAAPVYPPLFARPGDLPSLPADAHPEVYAMYQSHLTNKAMKLVDYYTEPEHTVPLYQVVNDLPLSPNQLKFSTDKPSHRFTFEVSEDNFKHRPVEEVVSDYRPSQWRVNRATRFFGFRCAKYIPQQDGNTVQKTWMDTPTFWPLHCYFNCNGQQLELRRSNQWHKNLPVDLIPFIKAGQNTIDVFVNKLPNQKVETFVGAVECIKLGTADTIIKDVSERVKRAEDFIQSLASKSKSSAEQDDDELSIVSESVQVSIYDPIMGSGICKTPVRSVHCGHKECFDLETFLQSRTKRPENDVFEADTWACPICKAYSAPSTLHIEEYFVNVRNELVKHGRMDARSIVINKDGTWSVKEEPKQDEQGSKMSAVEQNPEPVGVVELD